jgi:hypothetical protein
MPYIKSVIKRNIKQLKQWIAALDSGKYPQGESMLQGDNGFCCLGVACKIFISDEDIIRKHKGFIDGAFPSYQGSSPKWLKEINEDFFNKTGITLSKLNDSGYRIDSISQNHLHRFTFTEIATLLELVYIHKILEETDD